MTNNLKDLVSVDKQKYFASEEDVKAFKHIPHVINISTFKNFFNVEEEKILKAWFNQRKSTPEDNDYDPILMRAEFFERHGLTPMYYVDPDTNRIFVTSEEFLNGRFN